MPGKQDPARQRELYAGVNRDKTCAAADCDVEFYAKHANTVYCSSQCRGREAMRRWRKRNSGEAEARKGWPSSSPEKRRAYSRAWLEGRGKDVRAAYIRENRHKRNAKAAVQRAIASGRLVREPCEVCGALKTDGHHEDYSKPLDVRWLCRKHHLARHRELAA